MEYNEALSQISEIHAQLAKGEIYRGFRSVPVAFSGLAGFVAAALGPRLAPTDDFAGAVMYWVAAGMLCGIVGGLETAYNYWCREDALERRHSRKVLGQFLPGLVAGAGVTWCFLRAAPDSLDLLPGLWALVFGLAIFSARPYLPRTSGWVALWYLAAGLCAVALPPADTWRFGWIVAGIFGVGQLAAALMLFWNVERAEHDA